MSETEFEQQETSDVPEPAEAEPSEPEPDIETEEEAEPGEAPPEPVEPQPEGLTEKELESRMKRIGGYFTTYTRKLDELLGEDFLVMEPCPLCTTAVPGFVFPGVAPEDVVVQVLPKVGLGGLLELEPDPTSRKCPVCNGRGQLKTESFVPGNETRKCAKCNGSGLEITATSGPNVAPPPLENGQPETPLADGVNPDDPAVAELRARGFTVFPPVQLPASG